MTNETNNILDGREFGAPEKHERNAEVWRLHRQEYWTVTALAAKFGISRQRVYAIIDSRRRAEESEATPNTLKSSTHHPVPAPPGQTHAIEEVQT